jgi:hypothetical protein
MELLLNLLWLMLALPGVLILRRQPLSLPGAWSRCWPRCLVILGCVLVLLFPVVSATDDLHPASFEIEECSVSKHAIKQSPGAKSPAWSHDGGRPMRLVHVAALRPSREACGTAAEYLPVLPERALARSVDGRAPPLA